MNAATGWHGFTFKNTICCDKTEFADPIAMFTKIGQHEKASFLIASELISETSISVEKVEAIYT